MKKTLLILSFSFTYGLALAQLSVENAADGGITILPKGIVGTNNTSGNAANVALGQETMASNTTGIRCTALGYRALWWNTTGNNNTALGFSTLSANETGVNNTGIGSFAMYVNANGANNTGVGKSALESNTSGNENTGVGAGALVGNFTGSRNTAVGTNSLSAVSGGGGNTSIGYGAGSGAFNGSDNTFVGKYADINGDYTNATAIGANAIADASNKVRIGDTNVNVVEGPVAYSFPSDRRLKENISYNTRLGLDFILKLQPVTYNYIADKSKVRHDGFIAQEVEQAMKDLGLPFSGVKKSDTGMYSLAYSDFVMPLVNAVKEQQALIQTQQSKLDKQQAEIEKLKGQNQALLSSIEEIKTQLLKLGDGAKGLSK